MGRFMSSVGCIPISWDFIAGPSVWDLGEIAGTLQ